MSTKWDGKTKGSLLGYKIFVFLITTFGIKSAYTLLKFVSFYYALFNKQIQNTLIHFYTTKLGFTDDKADLLAQKNFYTFGQILIDRVAFLSGKENRYSVEFENEEILTEIKEKGKGGILISGHVGNWETAANFLKHRISSKINVLMYDGEAQKIKDLLKSKTGGPSFNIIAIKNDFSHIIKIHNALKNNEFIAIHADRYLEKSKTFHLPFFGEKAHFPQGPFIVASKFEAPVTFVFSNKKSNYGYHLSASNTIEEKLKPEDFAKKFIEELEKKVKLYPEQWFNYYDFYK